MCARVGCAWALSIWWSSEGGEWSFGPTIALHISLHNVVKEYKEVVFIQKYQFGCCSSWIWAGGSRWICMSLCHELKSSLMVGTTISRVVYHAYSIFYYMLHKAFSKYALKIICVLLFAKKNGMSIHVSNIADANRSDRKSSETVKRWTSR